MLLGDAIALTVTDLPIVVQDLRRHAGLARFHRRFPRLDHVPCRRLARRQTAAAGVPANPARARADHPASTSAAIWRAARTRAGADAGGRHRREHRQAGAGLRGRDRRQLQSAAARRRQCRAGARRYPALVQPRPRRRRSSTGPGFSCWASRCSRLCWPRWRCRKEGEQKTILQVYVSNISAHEFLLGKIFAFMLIALAEVCSRCGCCSPTSA